MDTTGQKINSALLGIWEPRNNSNAEKYAISKDNETTYKIVKTSKSAKDPNIYRAYIVELDGDAFLNIQEQGEMADKGFYFYKVTLNAGNDRVTLSPVTGNIKETFTTGQEMKDFFKKYKGLSFFYDKEAQEYIKD
ncbi:unnamed protein product [Sphagnum jensenii]|uniref:Lipocalin-like domain-containing protein n=1 Tax=Sphagnum jensenii TaxID=128206 RepID=A0ABP0VC77_9BRYO